MSRRRGRRYPQVLIRHFRLQRLLRHMNRLVESFNGVIREMKKAGECEMESLFGALRQRGEELRKGFKEMQDEKELLEQPLQLMFMDGDDLEGWLGEHEGINVDSVDVDELIEPGDSLSKLDEFAFPRLNEIVQEHVPVPGSESESVKFLKMATLQEHEGLGFGSSLPVPSVQEIVRNDAKSLPERYIKNLEDRPRTSDISSVSDNIPIIDLSLLAQGDEDERRKLDITCQKWGFFQIINHGADSVLTKMKAAVTDFFDLPLSEKKKYAMAANDVQGYGQGYVVSEDQKLDWNDLLFLVALPPDSRDIKYWPLTISGFKEAVEEYAAELQRVSDEIFANLSLLMGVERDFLKQLHGGDVKQGIRMNYYPSCARPDLVLGVSPHSDASSITLLVQDDEITGLQIKHEGVWVPVTPIPNALVINVGDVMEAWSNGKYKSIEHRALTNVEKPRISAAAFVIPGNDAELNPLETMVDDRLQPRLFKEGVKYIEYIRYTLAKKMDGKLANIEYLKLPN